jgi:hydroxylysine kinase
VGHAFPKDGDVGHNSDLMASDLHAFMATMVTRSRPVATDLVVALARDRYLLDVFAARMTGERDENFKLNAADGAEYVLKIAHAAEDRAVTELPTAALLHIEQADPTFPCPRVVRGRSGATQVSFVDESGHNRTARILTYLPGRLLSSATRSVRQRRSCGGIAGRLTNALRGFRHPVVHQDLVWDVRNAAQVRRLLDELPDFPHREAGADLLDQLIPRIEAQLPHLRHQFVHNDLNPLNVLVDPEDEASVIGVIDFGDLTHTALIADVAVTAADQLPTDCGEDAESARASVLDIANAYHERVALRAEELAVLGTLVAARLAANLVVHEWHLYHNPSSGHYAPLRPDFIRARLAIARQFLDENFNL